MVPSYVPRLDHRRAERARLVGFFRGDLADRIAQVFFIKAAIVDTADKTKRITRGFKIDRRRTRTGSARHDGWICGYCGRTTPVATRQQRVRYHFVGGGSAVKHKIGFVSVKHLGGKFLRMLGGSFMDQQVAQFDIRVAHVGAKDVFTEKIIELSPGRVLF